MITSSAISSRSWRQQGGCESDGDNHTVAEMLIRVGESGINEGATVREFAIVTFIVAVQET